MALAAGNLQQVPCFPSWPPGAIFVPMDKTGPFSIMASTRNAVSEGQMRPHGPSQPLATPRRNAVPKDE